MTYSVQQYRDPLTRRLRWAVLDGARGVWYFAARRGREAAARLARRLNNLNNLET